MPAMVRSISTPLNYHERLELQDGDFIDITWANANLASDSPLVILLHGLGGGLRSNYTCGLMHAFNQRGWRAVLMHFRGAGEEPNRLLRAYHSGDTADFNYFLHKICEREPHTAKAAVGISLGGNVLLKWLGEHRQQQILTTGVAVSVPFILNRAADNMSRGLSRFYQAYLLRHLKKTFMRKKDILLAKKPELMEKLAKANCFWTFDEMVTAPLHGFANVHEYYRQCSILQYLALINTPTLIINAIDDPFFAPIQLPKEYQLSPQVTLEVSERGGHVGFITGNIPGKPVYWLEERIPQYLAETGRFNV